MSDKLKAIKMIATRMFLLGKMKLREDIRDSVQENYDKHVQTAATKTVKVATAYRVTVVNYNSVFALNVDPRTWNVTQLKQALKPLKTKDNTEMPTNKADLYTRYISWQGRIPRPVEDVGEEAASLEEDAALLPAEEGNEETEECIEAMLLLNGSGTEDVYHTGMV